MQKYNIVVSRKANEMMVEHVRFLATVNEKASLKLISDFQSILFKIQENPLSYPVFDEDEIDEGYRKCSFQKRYLVIYRIEGEVVYIDYVVDCRQNYKNLIG